jgi:hypothetical protein
LRNLHSKKTSVMTQQAFSPLRSIKEFPVQSLLLLILCPVQLLFAQSGNSSLPEVRITEAIYEGADHFVIHTPAATYWYDKAGGGLSRMIDRDGQDWIAFRREPWNQYPEAAASAFRGLPNFVFRGTDGGAGHPGHTKCRTEQLNATTLRTTSLSEKWQWEWTFFEDHAQVSMLRRHTRRRV